VPHSKSSSAASSSSFIATLTTVLVLGMLLLVSALVQIVTAFWGQRGRGFLLHLLAGGLYSVAGMFMIQNPLEAGMGLTFLVAICLLVGGALRTILSILGCGSVCLQSLVGVPALAG